MNDIYAQITAALGGTGWQDMGAVQRAGECLRWLEANGTDHDRPTCGTHDIRGTTLAAAMGYMPEWQQRVGDFYMMVGSLGAALSAGPADGVKTNSPAYGSRLRGFDWEAAALAVYEQSAAGRQSYADTRADNAHHVMTWLAANGFHDMPITSGQLAAAMGKWHYASQGYASFLQMAFAIAVALRFTDTKDGVPPAPAKSQGRAQVYNRAGGRSARLARAARTARRSRHL